MQKGGFQMIRIIIVDDHELIRNGVKMKLSDEPGIEIVGMAKNGSEAFELCKLERPDVVLMDIKMPLMDGLESTKLIKEYDPDIKVLMHTTFAQEENIERAKEYRCNGFIYKEDNLDDYVSAIKSVYNGFDVWGKNLLYMGSGDVEKKEFIDNNLKELKKIEIDLLKCKVRCLSYNEIAEELGYSATYVRQVAVNLKDKLGLKNVQELAVWGAKRGLV